MLSLLFIVFFADLFLLLYGAEANALAYLNISLLIFIAVMTALDYWRYRRLFRALVDFRKEPLIKDIVDDRQNLLKAYAVIIDDLKQIIKNSDEANEKKMREMIDYYTLWVHQIKTPIAAMHLLLQGDDTERGRELSAELFKIEQYVEMVLQYLRLGSDTTDYLIREVPLEQIVRQAVRKYAQLFIHSRVSLDLQPLSLRVLTDEKWLGFVVEQVLSNAVKYARGGTVTIFTQGDTLIIQDNGIGIAPEDLPRVFENGYTGCNGRTDKRSTGIGLYLCRQICDRLGHRISLSSQVGKGTEVRIELGRSALEVE